MRRYAADISSLAEEFQQRFRDFAAIEKEITLFSSPFSLDPDDAPDHLQLELIELQCDAKCRSRHQQLPLVNFYRQLDKGRFQEIRTFAKKMLSLFGSTYLCEKTFSVMNINKNRLRTRLSDSHLRYILRIKTTVFEPDLAYLLQSRSQKRVCRPCPEGWEQRNSTCYYFSTERKSWNDSRSECLKQEADLVIIESEEEQDFIFKHTREGVYWIGLSDSETEGTWLWVDGTPLQKDKAFWKRGEPNDYNGSEDCAFTVPGQNKWNDGHCNVHVKSVCKTDALLL
ncbi:hypothetical protein AAFF_G00042690 [Aldrovandia affinis]|uniref:C-type lectin domain-containing protein n=1 Tax=Aldrovandia affinis TaxID=143900 RepID=A0AAD7VXN8_9TELE|nr:hypothetical protein AAFF_G00042690 [Aldrovandia affinis]